MPPTIPEEARVIAARIAELFKRDQEITVALNQAQRELLDANDRLTSGLSAEALLAVYGPAGPDLGLSGKKPPVLAAESPISALEEVAQAIRSAFYTYQRSWEQRRQLAFDVGEASAQLAQVLTAAGFSEKDARAADVHALAEGVYRRSTVT
jgi:hypothetical protein